MADENVIRREFQAELVPVGDGRTLDLRIVPHGVTARVSDDGGRTFYEEEWVRGVFRNKENKPGKVLVNVEHGKGFSDVVGRGTAFKDSPHGFDGEFRVLSGPDGDKALELVNEGAYTGVSVEAMPIKSERTKEGVVRRISAKLLNVSLCRNPAFADSRVLAVRENQTVNLNFGDTSSTTEAANITGMTAVIWTPTAEAAPEPEPEPAPEPDSDRATEVLARIGYEPIKVRATVDRPWDGSPARFSDEEYERSCLVCRSGDEPPKTRCSLPVLEPNGDLNVQGMHAAASRLSQTSLSTQEKAMAARKLVRYYRQARETPPPSLLALASR
jgi:HK97 family phage prohead protease